MTGTYLARRSFAIALLIASTAAQAQTVSLSPNQVRNLAVAALQNDQPQQAALAADLILERAPDDASALLIRAEAAIGLRNYTDAISFGRRAFWNAEFDTQRYSAARLIALGHARQEQDSRAQLWLRAAREYAPNDAAAQSVARDFRVVRQRNPLTASLRFGITPSTNINGGSANSETSLFGLTDEDGNPLLFDLSEDAQALSGWEYSGSVNLRYRAHTDRTSATFLDFGLSAQTFTLTESSEDRANQGDTSVRGSDFSNATLSFGATHRFSISPDAGVTEAAISVAQTWRAGDPNRRFATISANHTFEINDTDQFTVSGFSQRQERIENGDQTQVFDLGGTYSTRVDGIGRFTIGLSVRDNIAEDTNEDFDSVRYRLGFSPEDPFYGVNFGFNLSYEERDFGNVDIVGGERNDEITTLSVRAVLSEVEYFGFQPVLTAERTRQESDSNLFDRDFTEFGFDIVSSF